jgi:hypothetical protein
MRSKFVQWILSKLFPYDGLATVDIFATDATWDKQKRRENEEFYGGQDGTGRY